MSPIVSRLIVVGIGLLGSSIGLAAKKRGLAETVIGIDHCQETLDVARRRGAVDLVLMEPDILSEIDDGLTIVCTPVGAIVGNISRMAALNDRLLFSDVGSTKENICRELERRKFRFIGAHPIAGSEKNGPEFGNADLFQGRLTILTPTASSRSADVERLQLFWESLGSQVVRMEPERHDKVLAKTSHLPHAVAAALSLLLTETERPFCGTGFTDTTRIAAGPPTIWTDIFFENRRPLLAALEEFGHRLDALKAALQNGDTTTIAHFLESAQKNVCTADRP